MHKNTSSLMKKIAILMHLIFSFGCLAQPKATKLQSQKYAGTYDFTKVSHGRYGSLAVFPETNNTLLFYIDLNRGEPSFNYGSLYGRVKIVNDTGTFYMKFDYAQSGCKWFFKFSKDHLTIKTKDEQYECGFGNGVIPDGDYKRTSAKTPESFKDQEGKTISFKTTKPEEYNKDR